MLSLPLKRMMPSAPSPGGVASAMIVSCVGAYIFSALFFWPWATSFRYDVLVLFYYIKYYSFCIYSIRSPLPVVYSGITDHCSLYFPFYPFKISSIYFGLIHQNSRRIIGMNFFDFLHQ